MIKEIKALLTQPYNMFYTLMMWLSFSLSMYYLEQAMSMSTPIPTSRFDWQIEYPLISAGLFGLLVTFGITVINTLPTPKGTKYDRIISYILSMLLAFLLFAVAYEHTLSALGAASAMWMWIEQGRDRTTSNACSTKEVTR